MSDIVHPRIESYYLHPKKYAWRSDKERLSPDQTVPFDDRTPEIQDQFKMVIHDVPHEQPKSMSQEAPLDFSVKATSSPVSPKTNTANKEAKFAVNNRGQSQDEQGVPADLSPSHNGKILQSPVANGSITLKCEERTNERPSLSPRCSPSYQRSPENGLGGPWSSHDEFPLPFETPFQSTNHHAGEAPGRPTRETYVTRNGRHSPKLSREDSPDRSRYNGSILHEALARNSGNRFQDRSGISKNFSCTTPVRRSPTPPFKATHSRTSPVPTMLNSHPVLPPGPTPINPFNLFNGMGFQSAMAGMGSYVNGNMLSTTLDGRMSQNQNLGDKKLGKPVRPFKALTNELLYGIPVMGLPPVAPMVPSGGYFRDYVHGVAKETGDFHKNDPAPKKTTEANGSTAHSSQQGSPNGVEHKLDVAGSGDSNCSYQDGTGENPESTSGNRKRGRMLPEDLKDEAYWERRRKNNQAAKRSRDARRQKEDLVAQQAWMFREQNTQLMYQLAGKEEQLNRLQIQFRAVTEQCRNLELQLRLTSEKLGRNRCGKCGSRTDLEENFDVIKAD